MTSHLFGQEKKFKAHFFSVSSTSSVQTKISQTLPFCYFLDSPFILLYYFTVSSLRQLLFHEMVFAFIPWQLDFCFGGFLETLTVTPRTPVLIDFSKNYCICDSPAGLHLARRITSFRMVHINRVDLEARLSQTCSFQFSLKRTFFKK